MRRRELTLIAAVPVGAPLRPARAPIAGIRRVGVVFQDGPYERSVEGLRDGLKPAWLEADR
jgi:hypothetical protein